MRVLGEATGVTSAYVFENVASDDRVDAHAAGSPAGSRAASNSTVDDPRLAHLHPAPHFPRWAEILGRGEVVSSHVRDLPEEERETLAARRLALGPRRPDLRQRTAGGVSSASRTPNTSATGAAPKPTRCAPPPGSSPPRSNVTGRARPPSPRRCARGRQPRRRRLVAAPSWRDAAPGFLQELGEASGASRSYLFENGVREDGRLTASQRFEWAAPGIAPELDNPVMQDMCFEEVGLERLAELGARNELFIGKVSDLPPDEREFFEGQAIKSLMTVPIFVGGEWWGFIGFDDCVDRARVEPGRDRRSANEPRA